MPLFHATTQDRLPSIFKHGLGGGRFEQRWEGCDQGTYLSTVPEVCVAVMFEHMIRFSPPDAKPSEDLKSIRVIVIDDSRYDKSKLGPDPMMARDDVCMTQQVIDVTGMPVLELDDIRRGSTIPDVPMTQEDERSLRAYYDRIFDDRRERFGA